MHAGCIQTCIVAIIDLLFAFLQEILTNNYCIEFSASQYEKIYWNLISDDNVSVLNTLQHVKWAIIGEYPDEWTKGPNKSPVHSNCTNSS